MHLAPQLVELHDRARVVIRVAADDVRRPGAGGRADVEEDERLGSGGVARLGDGEDAPADIPNLLARLERDEQVRIVFAERVKRSEGPIFATFYFFYRLLHLILVGHRVRVGNFSVMRRECLESLCTASELWNNYAAASFATRQRIALVPTHRAHRLAGRSSMTPVSTIAIMMNDRCVATSAPDSSR